MRRLINIITEAEGFPRPSVLYHGSRPENVASILEHGLKKDNDDSWKHFGKGVYLALDAGHAKGYGEAVFEIDVSKLDSRALVPDDDDLYSYFDGVWGDENEGNYGPDEHRPDGIFNATWIDSLRICGQCQYLGDIPVEAISMVTAPTVV